MTAPRKTSLLATPQQYSDGSVSSDAEVALPAGELKQCTVCRSRFSGEARFCPFDGEALRAVGGVDATMDPLLGTVVDGRYDVRSVLGEGGMGTVYEVRHVLLERFFAMKVLRADLSTEAELAMRFTREARAAAAVSHPNVVHITDFGALPSGQPYFVMERLNGTSLSAVLRSGRLSVERAVSISRQVALALSAAHEVGIVHRDLKPDNIFVCEGASTDVIKVLDFGLAKVAGQSRLTKAGMVFGTPHYMSPEQAAGGLVDHRSDMYALGVLMYEMLTGRVPFEADTFMGVMTKHMYVEPTPPHEVLGIDGLGALEDIILRCLDKKSERRFETMKELVTALDEAAPQGAGTGIRRAPRPPRSRPASALADVLVAPAAISSPPPEVPLQKLRPWQWALLSTVVALFVFVVWWRFSLSQSHDTPIAAESSISSATATLGATSAREPNAAMTAPAVDPALPATPPEAEKKAVQSPSNGTKRSLRGPTQRPTDAPRNRVKGRRSTAGGEIIDPWAQ